MNVTSIWFSTRMIDQHYTKDHAEEKQTLMYIQTMCVVCRPANVTNVIDRTANVQKRQSG